MASLSAERITQRRGEGVIYPAKCAAVKIYAGSLVGTNSSGYAGPLTASTYATAVLGVAEETVDNSGGSEGDLSIKVRRGCTFAFDNDGTNAAAQSHIGKKPGFMDATSVNNAGGTPAITPASSADARIDEIDSDGQVWVFIN